MPIFDNDNPVIIPNVVPGPVTTVQDILAPKTIIVGAPGPQGPPGTGGGSSSSFAVAPIVVTPEAHGAVRDGKIISDAAMTLGSAVVSSASNPFTLSDVGKTIVISRAGLDVNKNIISTTITGFTDAGHVTVGATAAIAISNQPVWWGTDDSAAIIAAIEAARSAARSAGSDECSVLFSDGCYCVFGALQQNVAQAFGGTTKGNAQIPLPNIPTTMPKVTLSFQAPSSSAAVWDESRVLGSGCCILSNIVGGFDGTFGSSSLMGGPTVQQVGSGYSTNLLFILDGITFITPFNWLSCALDLQNVAMHQIGTVGFNGAINPVNSPVLPTGGGLAFRTGTFWNESRSTVDRLFLMGYTYGLIPGGNTSVKDGYIVYCQHGVAPEAGGSRAVHLNHLITDGCTNHLSDTLLSAKCRVDIDQWDSERSGLTTWHLANTSNNLTGHARFHAISDEQPLVNITTPAAYTIENFSQSPGPAGPPTVPAASTNFANPYNRRGFVKVTGGTSVTVTVDGQARAENEWAPIGAQGSINLGAYTVAPTWIWYLV